jgi:aryl-alcohol dehydrogenase-like predicted oxidoreductase
MSQPNARASGQFTIGGDLKITRLGYGAMRITGPGIWGEPKDRQEAIRTLRRLPELGIDFIDTAESYGPYVSEHLIAEALHPYKGLTIATKGGLARSGPDKWDLLGRPEFLRQGVLMSLRRLKLERIDLWQLHRIDPKVPRDEQFGVIADMMKEGLIRHAGLSQVSVEEIEAANKVFPVVTVRTATTWPTAPTRRCCSIANPRRSASFPGIRWRRAIWPSRAGRWMRWPRRIRRRRGRSPWPGC